MRTPLYQSIVLSGGTTMLPGLSSRLERDLKERYTRDILKGDRARLAVSGGGKGAGVWRLGWALRPQPRRAAHHGRDLPPPPPLPSHVSHMRVQKFKLNVEDPPRRKHMVFLGASVLGDIMKDR